jgi:hypothetical protein
LMTSIYLLIFVLYISCKRNTTDFIDNRTNLFYNFTMKTLIISMLFLASVSAQSQTHSWNDPRKPFDATTKRVHNGPINIEWRVADNVQLACELASKNFGNDGYKGQKLDACAFWWGAKCVIITSKTPTMGIVGHEIRHCFYGHWH